MILKLITKGQLLQRDDFPNRMISGNVKIDKIEFEFDDSWNGFTKTVVFSRNGKIVPVLLNDTNICDVPPEVTTENGLVGIGVFGVKGEQKYVSEEIQIFFEKGVPTDGDLLGEYTPDIYQQILNLATEAVDTSKRVEAETKELNEQSKAVLEAETERMAAEEERQYSEDERKNNELLRDEHESNRQGAEEERQQTFETLKDEFETNNQAMNHGLAWFENETQNALNQFQADTSTALSGFDVERQQALDHFAEQSAEELEKVQTATDRANETIDNMPNVYANVLKGTASGEVIGITDISPIEHNLGAKLSSKNIIPFPYETKSSTINGITYTVNEDNSITMNGTCEGSISTFYLTKWSVTEGLLDDLFEDGKTYKISGTPIGYGLIIILQGKEKATNKDFYYYSNNTFKVDKSKYMYAHLRLQVNVGKTMDNITIYPMIENGTTATAYTPHVDVSTTTLNVLGKNLFKSTDYTKGTLNASTGGINTNNPTVNKYCLTTDYVYLKSGAYVVSNIVGANLRYIAFYNTNKEFKGSTWTNREKTFKFTITEDCYVRIDIERDATVAIDNFDTFCDEYQFMLEVGTTKTKYEKYIEPTSYTPNADGIVEGVKSIYPNTTLYTDTSGVLVECEYNKDTNKVIENLVNAIISLGGNV